MSGRRPTQPPPLTKVEAELRFCLGALMVGWAMEYISTRIEFAPCPGSDYPCWVWKRGGDGRYGHAYIFGTRFKAHVLSFIAHCGALRRHEVVDHVCNRTDCVQPRHLAAATQSQNIKRCFLVGRGRSPFKRNE